MIRHRLAIALGLVVVLTLGGAGASYAFWTASTTVSTSVTAKTTGVAASMSPTLTGTLTSATPITGGITITNTGTVAGTYSTAVATSGPNALAAASNVVAWPTASTSSCAAPTGTTTSGTWASFPPLTGTLGVGTSASYCIRVSLGSTAGLASGSITPTIAATLTAGTNWITAPATVSATETYTAPAVTWYQIKANGVCATVNAAGTAVTGATCKTTGTDQAFQRVDAGNGNVYFSPYAPSGTAWIVDTGNNKPVTLSAYTAGNASQLWTVSPASGNPFSIRSVAGSGFCLTMSANSLQSTNSCDTGAAGQQFSLTTITWVIP